MPSTAHCGHCGHRHSTAGIRLCAAIEHHHPHGEDTPMPATYQMPYLRRVTLRDGTPAVETIDGALLALPEWQAMRVTPDEYHRLMARRHDLLAEDREWDPALQCWIDRTPEEPNP